MRSTASPPHVQSSSEARPATGTIASQPFASAVMIGVEARRTSITSAVTPASSAGTTASAVGATSIRTGLGATVPERADLEAERVQIDEPLGVALAVHRIGLERREVRP